MAAWHAYRLAASNYLHLQVSAPDTNNLQQSLGAFWCTVMQVNISASNDSYRVNRNSPKCQFAAPGRCRGQRRSVSSAASITTRSKRVTGKQHAGRGIYRLRNCESLLKDMIVAKAWMRPSILWRTMLKAGSELKEQEKLFHALHRRLQVWNVSAPINTRSLLNVSEFWTLNDKAGKKEKKEKHAQDLMWWHK